MIEQIIILATSRINLFIAVTNPIAILLSRRKKKKNPHRWERGAL